MKYWIQSIILSCVCTFAVGCGVKGKPLAPLEPEVLGIGKPDYRGAKEAIDSLEAEEKKNQPKPSVGAGQ